MIGYDIIDKTPIGAVCVAASERGLCAVLVGDRELSDHARRLRGMFPGETVLHAPERAACYRVEIEEYFAGTRRCFESPLDLSAVKGGFQRRVLEHLTGVPFGKLVTYGELARQVGSPDASQAVGAVMAANPIPIVIPCHRVVSTSGLGGYSAGGVANKKTLLVHEGSAEPELF